MDATLPSPLVLVVAPLLVMFIGWAAKTTWPHLKRAFLKRRHQRRCARGQHSMREIDRRIVHGGPDGPEEELLIACEWCGRKDMLDAHDLWS